MLLAWNHKFWNIFVQAIAKRNHWQNVVLRAPLLQIYLIYSQASTMWILTQRQLYVQIKWYSCMFTEVSFSDQYQTTVPAPRRVLLIQKCASWAPINFWGLEYRWVKSTLQMVIAWMVSCSMNTFSFTKIYIFTGLKKQGFTPFVWWTLTSMSFVITEVPTSCSHLVIHLKVTLKALCD